MENGFHDADDRKSDLFLDGKDIVEMPIEALRSAGSARLYIEQFDGYASALAGAPYGPAQYIANGEYPADLLQAFADQGVALALVPPDDGDCPGPGKLGDDIGR